MVRSSFIPDKEVRALRELVRYRFKLVAMRSSEKNRYQNSMTVSNISLANILSDPFGKTAQNLMDYVLSSNVFNEAYCKTLIQKSAKKKTHLILESLKDIRIEPDQSFKMGLAKSHMEFLDKMILKTEIELFVRMQPHYSLVEHLASFLPGISELSATIILAEIGFDMSVFESAKHLTSWAGLAPTNNESAGKKKSVRISKAGRYLKPILVQCALAAISDKKEPYFAMKYERIKKRRGHKKAIIAIARMMLTSIYHMILTGEPFCPSDLEEVQRPRPIKQVLNDETVFAYLASQGYDVSVLKKQDGIAGVV